MSKINVEFLTRKYEMCETVYNMEKKHTQIVLAEIPLNKRASFGLPKMERAYICSDVGSSNWYPVLGRNLRPATIFEK
ncbi:MAG: hypothetical protein LIR46_04375 [Bacteroidota bacterium]|nr:hypothetical protein [Bacteroidota bacterium]